MARLLMCPPHHYNALGAWRQWERFVEVLQVAADVQIELVDPAPQAPDLVFTANAALVSGDLAIVSTLRNDTQRLSRQVYRSTLARLGFATTFLQDTSFAGSADALFDRVRPIVYVGYGTLSDRMVTLQLTDLLDARVVALGLADSTFPHLDTALCPLRSGHVLAYMPALTPHAQRLLRRIVDAEYLIELSAADANDLACNAVEIGDALVMHDASRALREQLVDAGYRVFSTDLLGFVRAGAGAKRLTLRLDDGPAAAGAAA
ncbi:MAG TPA: arginine deiminase-related protein [Candidatus Acidoferrales bacterium]|nr:arginine deiminase-related protein [Candidatus Acidoferrales bacterium]